MLGGVVKCAKLKILNQILKMDDFHLGSEDSHSWKNGYIPPRNTIVSFFHPPFSKGWVSSFPHESHAKMKFLMVKTRKIHKCLYSSRNTNHFPRMMVVLFLGWKPLGQRSSRFELKISLFVKAINHCVTPLSFYKYNILTIGNIVIIIEGQGKKIN